MLPRHAARRGNPKPDPYGRHAWWVFALVLVGLVGLLIIGGALGGVGKAPGAVNWPRYLALVMAFAAWSACVFGLMWWRPRSAARGSGPVRILRISPRRRVAFLLMPVPIWLIEANRMANGEHFSLTFLLFFLLVNGAIWVMTRERLIFSEHGIERVAGIDPHRRVAWEDVTAARVFPGGVILEHRAGRPLRVWNRFLDGCPELAAEMLARLPASVLDANTGNRGMLERQAALLPKAARGRVT